MLHVLLIISFITLAVTGLPLKFYYAHWAGVLMKILGGVEIANYLHRTAAVILVGVFLIHVVNLVRKFIPQFKTIKDPETGRFTIKALMDYMFRPDSLIPHWRDVRDFWNHQLWFFGKGEKPRFERWTYWEKFDYFAVFWGVVIIGGSGLIMWFPTFFTTFLPGWIINVALIIHSDEALLAAGFIFTFHFFNVHFRIEKFPMDTVVFSGKVSRAELVEERGQWYDRLFSSGQLEKLRSGDEWDSWRPIAKTFGFLAFGTGIVLALAIFGAMLIRLIIN
jgi:cytochrome b subunit of formate dehydrogenase